MKKLLFILLASASIYPVQAQLNIDLLAQIDYPENVSNIWGWTAPGGEEYVILGTYDGTYLIDISTPTAPVELQFIDGDNSTWRQIATWSHYAYVVNETGGGLLCIDLSGLPGTAAFAFSTAGVELFEAHQVWADENGIIYVFGSNLYGGSTVMLDASSNPLDPVFVGATDTWYVHHGFSRGDTLYESNIYQGMFSIWDVSNKAMPLLLATQETPGLFTHNVVPSDDGQYLFTTDEKSNGSLAAYDISDFSDIQFLSEFRANPGTNSIPHYAWYFNGFVVTAWYKDGVVITDVTHPELMVKTGYYDTYPTGGSGFSGAWGCYPYFPSGTLVVSDINAGLFILDPTYVKSCYVEGNITDVLSGLPLFDVDVEITSDVASATQTDLSGHYITTTLPPGTHTVQISKTGYETVTTDLVFSSGATLTLNVALEPIAEVCAAPALIGVSDITETTATLDWTNMGATSYSVLYRKIGGGASIVNTTNSYLDVVGLEPCSVYKWRVRASCGDGSKPKSPAGTFYTAGASCRSADMSGLDDGPVVYPNPASEKVFVITQEDTEIKVIELYDMEGKLALRYVPEEDNFGYAQMNLYGIPTGMYLLRCVQEEGAFTRQLLVE